MKTENYLTAFQKLWKRVRWNCPLVSFPLGEEYLVKTYGVPTAISDEYDDSPGPCKYWHIFYTEDKDLEIVLQSHNAKELVVIYANRLDLDEIIKQLNFPVLPDWKLELTSDYGKIVKQAFCI